MLNIKNIRPEIDQAYINRLRGPMARRLTTNQEIAGSIPAVIILFFALGVFVNGAAV